VLSRQLVELAGPLGWGGNRWRLQAFVARLITHFDASLERFLSTDGDGSFGPSPDYCRMLAQRYREEFLSVCPDWHRRLAEAKLLSLRVPASLVLEAKLAWFRQNGDPGLVARGLLDRPCGCVGAEQATRLTATGALPPEQAWPLLEEEARWLLAQHRLTEGQLCTLMDCRSVEQYEHYCLRA